MGAREVTLVAVLAILTATPACAKPDGVAEAASEPKEESMAIEESGGEALAGRVSELYIQAMQDLVALLEDRPPAAEAKPKVDALHEEYVQKLVEIGKRREELGPEEQKAMETKVQAGMSRVPMETFRAMKDLPRHYRKEDNDLANAIAGFNVLTQYAFFDLLKQQQPEEAARLGVE